MLMLIFTWTLNRMSSVIYGHLKQHCFFLFEKLYRDLFVFSFLLFFFFEFLPVRLGGGGGRGGGGGGGFG